MVDAVATVALETLRILLIEEAKFLYNDDAQVEEVGRQLQTMHSLLKDADKRREHYNFETVGDWVVDLRDLSTQAENVLERYRQITKEIEDIRSRMPDLTSRAESITKIGESSSSPVNHDVIWTVHDAFGYETEQHFVEMKDEIQLLESLLTSSDKRSDGVICICGMGGLGKTTLAEKIYRGEAAQRCFGARAWVCMTQEFQLKNVLQELLKQFLRDKEDQNIIREMEEEELRTQLFGVQDEKKCLVVVDDIWEADHWNTLSRFFRISEDRCRVLVTTRNVKVVAGEYHVHNLKYLSEDEGWDMLKKIALPQGLDLTGIWPLLEKYGREMVRKCGFLPLAVSVIGEILRQENTLSGWNKVRENVVSYLQRGDGVQVHKRVEQVLDLSYNVLPYDLKHCFLYLGCFPEDTEIPTEELYLLWMAEGMVSSQDRGREETERDVAEGYLSELANRHMVQLTMDEASIYNRFKSCRLHNLMRDFCLLKGKEERFLEVVDTEKGWEDVSSVSRLAIHLDKPYDIHESEILQTLIFPMKGWKPFREWNSLVSVNFGMFKSLKTLILQGFRFDDGELHRVIENLILLKHLSVRGSQVDWLPSLIFKLPSLQSLDLRTYGTITLTNSVHHSKSLRHLFLHPYQREVFEGVKLKLSGLIELETLIGFNSDMDNITDLNKLPKLRVLDGIVRNKYILSKIVDHILKHQDQFRETRLYISSVDGCSTNLFKKTLMCHSLSKLFIGSHVNKLPSYEPELGKNLIRLNLSLCYILEDPMKMLEKLPRLRILAMLKDSFTWKEMICRANGFPELRELTLRGLTDLEEWRVDEGAMPNLSKLLIRHCPELKMIPEGLKFITTLKQLQIEDMPEKFEDRVRVVEGKEGEDYHKIRHILSIQIFHN